ncbi:MAG: Fe-S cluster assembly protein SufD [Alphaproteobacteria bacterium]|nr:Fe-S cluster assembly protein SufD [Alphaproteobacteria bacterium]
MSAATAPEQFWFDEFAARARKLPGAGDSALMEKREAAMALFRRAGLPHRRIEAFKYTDLRARLNERYDTDQAAAPAPQSALPAWEANRFVIIDGILSDARSDRPEGLEIASLAKDSLPPWALARLGAVNPQADHVMSALNLALMQDGVAIRVPRGFAALRPLHLQFLETGGEGAPAASHARVLIVLEEGASLTLTETHEAATGRRTLASRVTELALERDAALEHVRFTAAHARHDRISSLFAEIGAGAAYRLSQIQTGDGLERDDLFVRLEGMGAQFLLGALRLLEGTAHADLTTIIDHAGPGARADQRVKSVLAGKSCGIYQGKVIVREGALGTDSHQLARAVLLSGEAEAMTKPELEIFADDVKCGHGATVGALDPDALFYLRARGVPLNEANAMLLEAFLAEDLDGLSPEPIREVLRTATLKRLVAMEPAK